VRATACARYLAGFCPEGPACKFGHPKYELPAADTVEEAQSKKMVTCSKCGGVGHTMGYCTSGIGAGRAGGITGFGSLNMQDGSDSIIIKTKGLRPVESVTCFKCGETGHYANSCVNPRRPPPSDGYRLPGIKDALVDPRIRKRQIKQQYDAQQEKDILAASGAQLMTPPVAPVDEQPIGGGFRGRGGWQGGGGGFRGRGRGRGGYDTGAAPMDFG